MAKWTRRMLLVSLPEMLMWIGVPEEHCGKFTRRLLSVSLPEECCSR
jgi:hypothetical protein